MKDRLLKHSLSMTSLLVWSMQQASLYVNDNYSHLLIYVGLISDME